MFASISTICYKPPLSFTLCLNGGDRGEPCQNVVTGVNQAGIFGGGFIIIIASASDVDHCWKGGIKVIKLNQN